MSIYYILLMALFLIFIVQRIVFSDRNSMYIFIASTLLFIIIGFRDYSVGVDTSTYVNLYLNSREYVQSYMRNIPAFNSEFMFFITANLIRITGADARIYFIITALFIVISVSLYFKKYSYYPFLSYWLYITLGMLGISMSALRQILAICITLYSFDYLVKGEKVKYIISVLMASFFHFSAIIILPLYLVRKVKLTSTKRLKLLIVTVIVAFTMKDFIVVILQKLGMHYAKYFERIGNSGTNPIVIIIGITIPLLCTILYESRKNIKDTVDIFNIGYIISCINCLILIVSLNIDIFSRVAYYFGIANLILLPNAIYAVKNKYLRVIMFLCCMIISLMQFAISTPGDFIRIDNYLFGL